MWDFFTTVLLVVKIFWFSRFNIEIVSLLSISHEFQNPQNFEKNTLVIYLDFVFVVNLLIHNLILYSVFKVHTTLSGMVENKGLEPLTPCVQGRCSPS